MLNEETSYQYMYKLLDERKMRLMPDVGRSRLSSKLRETAIHKIAELLLGRFVEHKSPSVLD